MSSSARTGCVFLLVVVLNQTSLWWVYCAFVIHACRVVWTVWSDTRMTMPKTSTSSTMVCLFYKCNWRKMAMDRTEIGSDWVLLKSFGGSLSEASYGGPGLGCTTRRLYHRLVSTMHCEYEALGMSSSARHSGGRVVTFDSVQHLGCPFCVFERLRGRNCWDVRFYSKVVS